MNNQTITPRLFEGEKWCVITGLMGIVLGILIWLYIFAFGNVEPVHGGDLFRAASFNVASGLFIFTLAAFIPLANFKPRTRKLVRFYIIFSGVGSYVLETIQHARGVSPRMPLNDYFMSVNFIISQVFALMALGIVLYTVMIFYGLFRKSSYELRPLMVLAARYGMIGSILGIAGGFWMIVDFNVTLSKELSKDILYFHGYAFHGLQTVPMLAWMLEQLNFKSSSALKLVHLSGWVFNGAIVLLGIQVLVDHKSVFTLTPLMIGAYVLALIYCVAFAYVGIQYLKEWKRTGRLIKSEALSR